MTSPDSPMPANDTPAAAAFGDLGVAGTMTGNAPIDRLLDLSLPVAVEFGRTHMTVQELLQLGRGSVIQLDRLAGEPIDIFVSERKLAEGEVVVIGEHFGVRITRLLQPQNGTAAQP